MRLSKNYQSWAVSRMSKVDIRNLFPSFYDEIIEIDEVAAIENELLTQAYIGYQQVLNNQFVATSDVQGIQRYENMLDIVANATTESLEFRKTRIINRLSTSPPFTLRFLKNKLDELIGTGKWEAYIDFESYTLYVESTVKEQIWLEEILVTMTRTKPCNMVFINKPLLPSGVVIGESVELTQEEFNYRLGSKWALGKHPFESLQDKGVIKVPEVSSVTKENLLELSQHMLSRIAKVRLNGAVVLTEWSIHRLDNTTLHIEYRVDLSHGLANITKVELLDNTNNAITNTVVYIPLLEPVIMKHLIHVKEG